MTVSEDLLREALVYGTKEGRPDTRAAWKGVKERLEAPKRRLWLRRAALAAVLLTIGGGFSFQVRAAASGLWQNLLQVTLSGIHYEVRDQDLVRVRGEITDSRVKKELNVVGNEEDSAPLSVRVHETRRFTAEAGRFPEEAQASAVLPIRVPAPLPEGDFTVHVSVDTPDEELTGSQSVSFSWEGDSLSDWILLAQRTKLARSTPDGEWEAVSPGSDHHILSIEGAEAAEMVRLSESVEAVRVYTEDRVSYYFHASGTDITLAGPKSRAELLEQMAISLAGA